MVEVLGKPIILHQIEHLKKYGVRQFIIACRYKWEVIRNFLGNGEEYGIKVKYCVESQPLGRGGAIKNAYREVTDQTRPVIATNGDNVFDVDVSKLLKHHISMNSLMAITLVPLKSPYGIVEIDGGRVKNFREKIVLPHWVNAGIYILTPQAIKHFPERGDHEDSTFPKFAREGRIAAYLHKGFWKGIDNPKDLSEAEKFLSGPCGRKD
ncbi:MAG: nucleotidyltransferase family protein [Patescibacteria group bacterium]|nr:MAG: nucleotidyltransferase family protein [Patescibacteria group bacterium]